MISRLLLFATVIVFIATTASAVWRGPPQVVAALDDETRNWVRGLTNKIGGSCCDTADGYPIEIDGWDMAGTVDDISGVPPEWAPYVRSGYRVRLADGKWHDVLNYALIDPKTNKLGYAVVWVHPPTSLHIHCFLPGPGS
jgi:hypothetical protein